MIIRILCAVAMLVVSSWRCHAGQDSAEQAVQLGRQFAAMPWLEETEDAPFVVVPYREITTVADIARETEFYEIDPDVVLSGYSYFFFVRGKDRDFLVGSIPKLAILCRELAAIEELKKTNKGKEFAKGMGESVVAIGTGMGNLVLHPGQSLASFGHRIRIAGRSVERKLKDEPVGADQRGIDRSHLGSGPAGQQRRLLAAALGVDVYTDNPVLREQLTSHSHARFTGTVATWAIPAWLSVFGNFNLLSGDEATEKLIVDYEPAELRRQVGRTLSPQFGQDREDETTPLGRLLTNPNFTPRQIAYIGRDLDALSAVGNLGLALEKLAEADTPERADLMTLEVRMHALFHDKIAPIQELTPFMNLFAFLDVHDNFHFLFAGDAIRPAGHNQPILTGLIHEAMRKKSRSLTLWVLGEVSPESVEAARAHNISVEQNLLLRYVR